MMRPVAVVGVLFLGLAASLVGRAPAQDHLLGRPAPEIVGGSWINSPPLTLSGLRGRVVLLEFWTFG